VSRDVQSGRARLGDGIEEQLWIECTVGDLDEIDVQAEQEIVKAVEFAEASPEPAMEELYSNIYADN